MSPVTVPSVAHAFRLAAAAWPGRVAVESGGISLTYAALLARAQAVAAALRAHGVRRGDLVAVVSERSPHLVPAILGILEAGAAYLPLDPAYPADRLALLLDDAGAKVLLCVGAAPAPLQRPGVTAIDVAALGPLEGPAPALEAGPEDPVYVMYTSGSTGRPKGVVVPHRAVLRLVLGSTFATFGPQTTWLLLSPVSFDASTLEMWAPLLNGGRLVLAPPGAPSLADVGRLIAGHGITSMWLTTGLFHAMVEERLADLGPLSELLTGGDVVSPAHAAKVLAAHPRLRLVNGYGPTENTTFSTCYTVRSAEPGRSLPIGRAIEGTVCRVLDEAQRDVPEGEPGELYVGGLGLALGYLNRPELTAERFVTVGGERWYRTGDRVRRLPSGDHEFLGRLDDQMKVRGFRIEPGEVEAHLCAHPQVREAAVGLREAAPGDKRLCAWFVPRAGGPVAAPGELRTFLNGRVPDWMIPSAFKAVEALPLNPNGKVDRRALPDPFEAAQAPTAAPPRTDLEGRVAEAWREVLHVPAVRPDDNFFDIGGTSLHLARVHERLTRMLGVDLEITRLFQYPTVAALARHLEARDKPDLIGAKAQDRADKQRAAQAARAALARGRKP